ncbi:MAG TPA: OmpA family protein, partial [Atribacterota bacterium]|nr:OmpA family protein [Atribacterota bacterium]
MLGCGGPIPSKPTINSFTAAPPTIAPGDSSVLSWNVTGATSVTISHGIGSVSSTGTRSTSPATTTTYLL